jgi:hypothetical protein
VSFCALQAIAAKIGTRRRLRIDIEYRKECGIRGEEIPVYTLPAKGYTSPQTFPKEEA